MLALDGILGTCYIIIWVAFIYVDMTERYNLWRGDVSGIAELRVNEVCLYDVGEVLVSFASVVLC